MTSLVKTRTPTLRPLPASLELGPVELTVSRLDRSVAWYGEALGLQVASHEATHAALGDGETTVLVLVEDALASPAGRHAGLYHYALLYPSREELARAAVRLASARAPIDGASDHGTHEAIYLSDPDGNGIELAADRPRALWPTPEEEFGRGGPQPLDLPNLLSTVEGEATAPHVAAGLRIGHVHLHVGDVEKGLAFYCDELGFDVWALLDSAAFVSAGGYHHHLGFNVWRGRGVGPVPPHTVGLREWTIELPTSADVAEVASRFGAAAVTERDEHGFLVHDPWDIALRVVAGRSGAA